MVFTFLENWKGKIKRLIFCDMCKWYGIHVSVPINRVVLEHSHTCLFPYCLWLLSIATVEWSSRAWVQCTWGFFRLLGTLQVTCMHFELNSIVSATCINAPCYYYFVCVLFILRGREKENHQGRGKERERILSRPGRRREGGTERERERERERIPSRPHAVSTSLMQGLTPLTVGSWPKPRSRVGCLNKMSHAGAPSMCCVILISREKKESHQCKPIMSKQEKWASNVVSLKQSREWDYLVTQLDDSTSRVVLKE